MRLDQSAWTPTATCSATTTVVALHQCDTDGDGIEMRRKSVLPHQRVAGGLRRRRLRRRREIFAMVAILDRGLLTDLETGSVQLHLDRRFLRRRGRFRHRARAADVAQHGGGPQHHLHQRDQPRSTVSWRRQRSTRSMAAPSTATGGSPATSAQRNIIDRVEDTSAMDATEAFALLERTRDQQGRRSRATSSGRRIAVEADQPDRGVHAVEPRADDQTTDPEDSRLLIGGDRHSRITALAGSRPGFTSGGRAGAIIFSRMCFGRSRISCARRATS